mmetsp:Transcript_101441/g.302556  ORF Transcript_101441/g.302556 Transcript_101441/m.302556 type:complete len:204 (+) Transcript_101441:366-977(+)
MPSWSLRAKFTQFGSNGCQPSPSHTSVQTWSQSRGTHTRRCTPRYRASQALRSSCSPQSRPQRRGFSMTSGCRDLNHREVSPQSGQVYTKTTGPRGPRNQPARTKGRSCSVGGSSFRLGSSGALESSGILRPQLWHCACTYWTMGCRSMRFQSWRGGSPAAERWSSRRASNHVKPSRLGSPLCTATSSGKTKLANTSSLRLAL